MHKEQWQLIDEAYNGTGGFIDGEHLNQYPRESDEKFKTRQEVAYYPNITASKIKRYMGYMFKKSASRNRASYCQRLF